MDALTVVPGSSRDVVIYSGFETVIFSAENPSQYLKGRELYLSDHVVNVCEQQSVAFNRIIGEVIRQTNFSLPAYKVIIELDAERGVSRAECNCAAGDAGMCKHISAVIYFVNNDETLSCTDQPQKWGKPSGKSAGKTKYSKGKLASEMFPCKRRLLQVDPADIDIIPEDLDCPLVKIWKEEKSSQGPPMVAATVDPSDEVDPQLLRVLNAVLSSQDRRPAPGYPVIFDEKYFEKIILTDKEIIDLASRTIDQADNREWGFARRLRISASKAHLLLHSRRPEVTARRIILQKDIVHKNLIYGRQMEKIAIQAFKEKFDNEILRCGVLIHKVHPWLCASPDGIILQDDTLKVLEVKCPISCETQSLFDEEGKPRLNYLITTENGVTLKRTHNYFTQIQILLYCTGFEKCELFIYSPTDDIVITVHRDDNFITDSINKLEKLYFDVYLKCLNEIFVTL